MDKSIRPSFDQFAMCVALSVSARATCRHREQGAVITRDNRIISCGYNGAPAGEKDCLERGFCAKAEEAPCMAEGLHGESNAIISAARLGISVDGCTMYCVYSPCRACCHVIKNSGIVRVVYAKVYDSYPQGPEYLKSMGVHVDVQPAIVEEPYRQIIA